MWLFHPVCKRYPKIYVSEEEPEENWSLLQEYVNKTAVFSLIVHWNSSRKKLKISLYEHSKREQKTFQILGLGLFSISRSFEYLLLMKLAENQTKEVSTFIYSYLKFRETFVKILSIILIMQPTNCWWKKQLCNINRIHFLCKITHR